MNCFNSSIAIHAGETLRETLEALQMSQVELAQRTGLTTKTINEIIKGKAPITPDTANKLSAVFGTSAEFWNNLERNFQETIARLKAEEILLSESSLTKRFTCYSQLVEMGLVIDSKDIKEKTLSLLNFFGVSSLRLLPEVQGVAFRKTAKENLSRENLAAWLRSGEIIGSKREVKDFNRKKLINSLDIFRNLTSKDPKDFSKELVDICASVGIALVFTPLFKNTFVNGSTRWLGPDKALVQITIRNKYSDIFWFTFFHEIGHLLKHGKKDQFIEFSNEGKDHLKEYEADEFACDLLIPSAAYKEYSVSKDKFDIQNIKRFAKEIGVHPSIVAGRLAHDFGKWKEMERLRDKLELKQA